jgi:predicted PilT family ATPase
MVRFPRLGDADGASVVSVRGPSSIAESIRAEIEAQAAILRSRTVLGVAIPRSLHASIIGRGGTAISEIQRKHGVKVLFPGWQEHSTSPDPVDSEELEGVEPEDVVKLLGPRPACEEVAKILKVGFFFPFRSIRLALKKRFVHFVTVTDSDFEGWSLWRGNVNADDFCATAVTCSDCRKRTLLSPSSSRNPH